MTVSQIPIITVSYNSVELITELLSSLRKFYSNPVYVIDGSDEAIAQDIGNVVAAYPNTQFQHFNYNIHHGPGMAWAITHLNLSGPVLFLDSDIIVLNSGFIESLMAALTPDLYGVGYVNQVDAGGFDLKPGETGISYLHPACMLCNIEVMRQWPLPTKHGAPMTEPMKALHQAGVSRLVKPIDWVRHDFEKGSEKIFLRHDWQGTVHRTGGYHLEDWQKAAVGGAEIARAILSLIPPGTQNVVEVGRCDSTLVRMFKTLYPQSLYTAINTDLKQLSLSRGLFDSSLSLDIETLSDEMLQQFKHQHCWILNQALEVMRDPWGFLARVRRILPSDGAVIACVPNMQHWFIQAKLACGDFRYESEGLITQHQLRWFTRISMLQMFQQAGFKVISGQPIIREKLENELITTAITNFARSAGVDPEMALRDAMPYQFIVKAIPG